MKTLPASSSEKKHKVTRVYCFLSRYRAMLLHLIQQVKLQLLGSKMSPLII